MTDTIFALAASLGFKDLGRSAMAAADSEGRTGGADFAPGAVPFTLPLTPLPPSFSTPGDGRPTPGQPGPPKPTPFPPPPWRS